MGTIPENVIDKIKKLFALSESPNEHEALVAMEKAHSLLAQYNLSMQDINTQKFDVEQQAIGTGKFDSWVLLLVHAIADYNYCNLLLGTNNRKTTMFLVGKNINIIATKNFIEYILSTIKRLVQDNYGQGKKYLSSYKIGLASSIINRLKELKYADMHSDCMALVVTEKAENIAFLKNKYKDALGTRNTKTPSVNAYGYVQGVKDGNGISFNNQINKKETVDYLA